MLTAFHGQQMRAWSFFHLYLTAPLLFGEFRRRLPLVGLPCHGAGIVDVQGFTEAANLKVIVSSLGCSCDWVSGRKSVFRAHRRHDRCARWPAPQWLLLVLMLMGTISAALVDE